MIKHIEIKARIVVDIDDSVDIDDVVNEMDYEFKLNSDNVKLLDTEIIDHEVAWVDLVDYKQNH